MKHTLSRDKQAFTFNKYDPPVLTVAPGDELEAETSDTFNGQLDDVTRSPQAIDWEHVNPMTGPVAVVGAEPGDVLKLHVDSIELAPQGIVIAMPGAGVLGSSIETAISRHVPIEAGEAIWDERLRLPLRPMIGVIGVAPAGAPAPTGMAGRHGGNLDNLSVTSGSTIYLPVSVPGALLGVGDLHALMGDGEVGVTGLEVSGRVRLQVDLLRDRKLANPLVETEAGWMTVASSVDLDAAVTQAVQEMADLLAQRAPSLTSADLSMLFSLAGDVQICQVIDSYQTARFFVPRRLLERYDITF